MAGNQRYVHSQNSSIIIFQQRASFLTWYEENRQTRFDFDEELEAYCKLDVEILKLAMCKYMDLSIALSGWNPVVQTSTYAGFSMFQVISFFYLEKPIFFFCSLRTTT